MIKKKGTLSFLVKQYHLQKKTSFYLILWLNRRIEDLVSL